MYSASFMNIASHHLCMYVCMYVFMNFCMYEWMNVCMYVHVCLHVIHHSPWRQTLIGSRRSSICLSNRWTLFPHIQILKVLVYLASLRFRNIYPCWFSRSSLTSHSSILAIFMLMIIIHMELGGPSAQPEKFLSDSAWIHQHLAAFR